MVGEGELGVSWSCSPSDGSMRERREMSDLGHRVRMTPHGVHHHFSRV